MRSPGVEQSVQRKLAHSSQSARIGPELPIRSFFESS